MKITSPFRRHSKPQFLPHFFTQATTIPLSEDETTESSQPLFHLSSSQEPDIVQNGSSYFGAATWDGTSCPFQGRQGCIDRRGKRKKIAVTIHLTQSLVVRKSYLTVAPIPRRTWQRR
jgi:hypothetical protein